MFTKGRILFAIIFILGFTFFMFFSYRKDAKNHRMHYKNAALKVAVYGFLVIMLFIALRLMTAYLF